MNTNTPEKMIGKKRENKDSIGEMFNKNINDSNKNNSAETKKISQLKLKEVKFFFAKLESKFEDKNFSDNEKFQKEDLIFKHRKEKAIQIITNIKKGKD